MKKSKANFLTTVIWTLALSIVGIIVIIHPEAMPIVGYDFACPGVVACIVVTRAYIYGGGDH